MLIIIELAGIIVLTCYYDQIDILVQTATVDRILDHFLCEFCIEILYYQRYLLFGIKSVH